jgi:sodium-coupled neutral amino acid transporter 11
VQFFVEIVLLSFVISYPVVYLCSVTLTHQRMIPACAIFATLGTISAYTFHLIGRLVHVANSESSDSKKATSLGDLWDKEIGPSSSWLISLACFLVCYGTCLAYSIILGDTFRGLAESAGAKVSSKDMCLLRHI